MTFKGVEQVRPGDFTILEKLLFTRIFNETLDKTVPALLQDIWNPKLIKVHALPDMQALLAIDEFADYKRLPDVDTTEETIKVVEGLAQEAAQSYAWNVRNAFIKGGRLRDWFWDSGIRLHVTDWQNEFHVNMVKRYEGTVGGPEFQNGWVAYRYRFAAAKL